MLDRKQYDLEMDRVNREQMGEIIRYLDAYLRQNATMRDRPISSSDQAGAVDRLMKTGFSREGRNYAEVADEVYQNVFARQTQLQHPRCLSLVCSSVSPYALLGAVLADIFNVNSCGYMISPGATVIEEKLIAYMAERIGFDPAKATGIFTSGGSLSNLTAMIAARESRLSHNADLPRGVAYTSDQAHSSVVKGMKMMGLRPDQIRVLPSDENYRIRLDLLEEEIKKDLSDGKRPFLIVGSCGTTNTGSIDPLDDLADIAARYDLWFHVDGAYGGSIFFSDIYRHLGKGAERADSISWDTHKWSLQPYSSSTVIAKNRDEWLGIFSEHPEYLADVIQSEHPDGWDRGVEMSRPFRAVKLWMTLQCLGTDKLADVIDYAFYNAKVMEKELRKKDYWEIVAPPSCAAINFRLAPAGIDPALYNDLTAQVSARINEDDYAYILTTALRGKKCCRVCLVNGNTTTEDILNTVEYLNGIAEELIAGYASK